MQARHYKTLANLYSKPNAKPNKTDVAQILDLEFEARRAFIDGDFTKEEDRPAKIFEAYPCFKEVQHVCCFFYFIFFMALPEPLHALGIHYLHCFAMLF